MTDSPVRNGVDTEALFATINLVKERGGLARFQFRATNSWVEGTHSRGSISGFYGGGQEHSRLADWEFDADHPLVLTGTDQGPSPVEYGPLRLAACLTAGLVNIAAARGVTLHSVTSTVEGDIDLQAFGSHREAPTRRPGWRGTSMTKHRLDHHRRRPSRPRRLLAPPGEGLERCWAREADVDATTALPIAPSQKGDLE